MAPTLSARAFAKRSRIVDMSMQDVLRQVAQLTPQQMSAVAPVLLQAEKETVAALRRFASVGLEERFTTQLQRDLLVQLDGAFKAVKRLAPALYKAQAQGNRAAQELAVQHVRKELIEFSLKFEGSIGVPLPLERAARIAEGRTLMAKYQTSARRYANNVGADIRAQIALGTARKETVHQMVNRLVAHGGPRGVVNLGGGVFEHIPEGLFRRYRYWAARVVRTEVIESYNVRAKDELLELHKEDSSILMRWDASLDGRMCQLCESLNDVKVRPTESFPEGIDHPPAHVQCRCAITAWREGWT